MLIVLPKVELNDHNFNSYEELCKKGLKLNKNNKLLRIKKNQTFKDFCINFKKSYTRTG